VTNKYWQNHEEKQNRKNSKLQKELVSKFFSKNKYNFILHEHYNPTDERKFIEKERQQEKQVQNYKQHM
jgi:hypothetical protein